MDGWLRFCYLIKGQFNKQKEATKMLKCECDRCHSAMEVPLSATPFIMPDPKDAKPEFMIFRHTENNQMEQLHLCPSCEKAFESFLEEK